MDIGQAEQVADMLLGQPQREAVILHLAQPVQTPGDVEEEGGELRLGRGAPHLRQLVHQRQPLGLDAEHEQRAEPRCASISAPNWVSGTKRITTGVIEDRVSTAWSLHMLGVPNMSPGRWILRIWRLPLGRMCDAVAQPFSSIKKP